MYESKPYALKKRNTVTEKKTTKTAKKDKTKTKIFPFDDFDSSEFKSFMFNTDRFGYKCNNLRFDKGYNFIIVIVLTSSQR